MFKDANELLKAVQARKMADAKKAEEEKKTAELKKKEEKKNTNTKKVKREFTKEFLVEEKEQPIIKIDIAVDEEKNEKDE